MRRYESDYLNFKEIFVQPREEVLRNIRTKEVPEGTKAGTPDRSIGNDEVPTREYRIRLGVSRQIVSRTFGLTSMQASSSSTGRSRDPRQKAAPPSTTR